MVNQSNLGAIESTRDYRDGIAGSAFGLSAARYPIEELPARYQSTLGPVLMQNMIPACVAHDMVDMIKLWWFKEHGEWVDFSPRFLDILSAEPDIPLDGGRRPRTVLKVAAKYGCATTKTCPNDTKLPIDKYRDKSAITQEARDEAVKYKIPGYIKVPLDFDHTRVAIYLYGMVSTLFNIGQELWTPSWNDSDIDPLRTPTQIISGHQMGQKGWVDSKLNTVRNEWSDAWANHGEANFDRYAWSPYIREQWSIAEIPDNVAMFLKELPTADSFHYRWNKNLAYGNVNDDVRFAQVALMILGYMEAIPPDELGIFGPKTSRAVLNYQIAKGIYPTAPDHIGPKTRAALNAQFSI